MPSISIIARKLLGVDSSLSFVDWLILLWLYSNPSDSGKRSLTSLQKALRRIPDFHKPDGSFAFKDSQLEQIILSSLKKLKERGFVKVFSSQEGYTVIELTGEGTNFLGSNVSDSDKNFLREYGMLK
ncbi:MAG: hypothetical protein KIH08_10835 [Candidatus Freyarchaeota archaeon]|nr:hypothetical protein [Candidatus Jordarchaeia archaeon]MBS7267766.1 hypothetical protein [Candidatus Jordarchaeia archaeon]MBS7279121.1 hypothetical protein [Candidatus Jordarchaeia archaeon]